jgi:hypothetical protein
MMSEEMSTSSGSTSAINKLVTILGLTKPFDHSLTMDVVQKDSYDCTFPGCARKFIDAGSLQVGIFFSA